MSVSRRCSRTACGRQATFTLTYVYADSTAVLGPLALYAEPHSYDLCEVHSARLSAPRGWEVLRLAPDPTSGAPTRDDLEALAEAVREVGRPRRAEPSAGRAVPDDVPTGPVGRRSHLRVLPDTRTPSAEPRRGGPA